MNNELWGYIKMKHTFLVFLSVMLYSLFFIHYSTPKAFAASPTQVIRVSPVIVHFNLTPDKTTTYELTVENLLSTPLPVKALFSDFDTTAEDGGYILTDNNTNSLLSWIELDNKEWILPAKSKQKISLTIKTPQKISIGGYYGILFFQPILPQMNNQTVVSARVGILLLGDIGVGTESAQPGEIATFQLPTLSQETTMPLLLRVKNTSLNFFTAKPILRIKPLFGQEQLQFLEEKIIFPGKIRRWEQPIRLENVGVGIYNVTMQVSTGNGKSIQQERTLIIFPWIPVLIVLLVVLILFWSITHTKRLKKALKAFFSKETQE